MLIYQSKNPTKVSFMV